MNDATDFCVQKIDRYGVFAAFRNDQIRIPLAWFDERIMHDPNGIHILIHDGIKRSSAFLDIADQPADEADIGRSTFYSHFETKDELLNALCREIFEHVFAEKLSRGNTHDFSGREKDLSGEITHILYHLQDSSCYISRILSCESGEMFMGYFKEYLGELFAPVLERTETDIPKE